jgi:proteic killer suppression protein
MIATFSDKGLAELFEKRKTAKLDAKLQPKILRILDALDRATRPEDMRIPGFDFHPLRGFNPTRYSVHVSGPWCVTFAFEGENAISVKFEQYH